MVNIIGDLRQQDNIRTSGDTRMKRQPANLMAHQFDHKHPSVRGCCCMDAVNGIGRNIHSTLETKGHICTVNIIVDRLWKRHDV